MFYKDFSYVSNKYNACFIDVYGVLYDGNGLFPGVLELMADLKKANKKLIILSNTSAVSEDCKLRYAKMGLIEGRHYDEFITSGEVFKDTVINRLGIEKTWFQLFSTNNKLFGGCGVRQAASAELADFVYVGFLNGGHKVYTVDQLKTKLGKPISMDELVNTDVHEIDGFDEIATTLDTCFVHKKTLVVANPDIFALEVVVTNEETRRRPVLCQGAIGEFYERMGGEVMYFGKPYPAIYDFAKKYVNNSEKTVMIGDTLWTDILGGNIANIDTVLTLTGVSGKFIEHMDITLSIEQKLGKLLNEVSKKLTHRDLMNYSQEPTYIVESFAS